MTSLKPDDDFVLLTMLNNKTCHFLWAWGQETTSMASEYNIDGGCPHIYMPINLFLKILSSFMCRHAV